MRRCDFEGLAENTRLQLLKDQGVYVGKVKHLGSVSLLYQLDAFYVEVTYRKYRHTITRFRYFDGTEKIGKYLRQIDLQFLNQPLQ